MSDRIIAHLDMDAFYAAIEERDNPQFSGKPIVVGADPKEGRGRGVVSTANYAARKFGIKSAMPISQAYQLAPDAVYLPPDIPKYQKESEEIFDILRAKIPVPTGRQAVVEKASTDEFYLDLSGSQPLGLRTQNPKGWPRRLEEAVKLALEIKREIKESRGLTASVGIGPNKLVAKIAADQNKPDGLTVVKSDEVLDFLSPMDVQKIPGIGPKTAGKFYDMGVKTIADLRRLSKEELVNVVGVFGNRLYDLARGEDDRPVGEEQPLKSVGKQMTFERDTAEAGVITDAILELAKETWDETTAQKLEPKTVTVVVRYENFETHTKAETPKGKIVSFDNLKKIVLKLLLPFLDRKRKVRLVGIRLSVS